MKRIFATAGLVLALGLGLASAQNITRSLQGSQDPRGPVGWDTSNAMFFPGHINAFGQMTTNPTPSGGVIGAACGSAAAATTIVSGASTDAAGILNPLSTTCSVIFGSQYTSAPACIVAPATATSGQSFAISTATTGFNLTSLVSGTIYQYVCIGNK